MFGKILAAFGLGQSDLTHVFEETLSRLSKLDIVTDDMRKGQRQAVQAMIDVLRDEDVMSSETKKELEKKLEQAFHV